MSQAASRVPTRVSDLLAGLLLLVIGLPLLFAGMLLFSMALAGVGDLLDGGVVSGWHVRHLLGVALLAVLPLGMGAALQDRLARRSPAGLSAKLAEVLNELLLLVAFAALCAAGVLA